MCIEASFMAPRCISGEVLLLSSLLMTPAAEGPILPLRCYAEAQPEAGAYNHWSHICFDLGFV
jgi:hypothetical protein